MPFTRFLHARTGLKREGVFGVSDTTIAAADAGANDGQAQGEQGPVFEPITSQDALDRIVSTRVNRVKSQFADYDDLKAAAGRVGELETAKADLEARVAAFEAQEARNALIGEVANDTGLDAGVIASLRGDTKDELTAAATALKAAFTPPAPHVPAQDKRPAAAPQDEARAAAKSLFG